MSCLVTCSWRDLPLPYCSGWEGGKCVCATVLIPVWMWGRETAWGAGVGAHGLERAAGVSAVVASMSLLWHSQLSTTCPYAWREHCPD